MKPTKRLRSAVPLGVAALLVSIVFAGCTKKDETPDATSKRPGPPASPSVGADTSAPPNETAAKSTAAKAIYDDSVVHDIAVMYDTDAYASMVKTYAESGTKDWIKATVVIDGVTYKNAGMRLKGNSSLFGLGGRGPFGGRFPAGGFPDFAPPADDALGNLLPDSLDTTAPAEESADTQADTQADTADTPAEASLDTETDAESSEADRPIPNRAGGFASASEESPEKLPWLIRLDKYVPDQNHQGEHAFIVRANSSITALNEAVALALLKEANLATQRSIHARFRVNDSDPSLRLVIENPNDDWVTRSFGANGLLYKADSTGDYSYRGDDPEAYTSAWDQDAGEKDLTPLIEFLKFVNEADLATFEKELPTRFAIDDFARYLAIEELLGNFDDIDGPGNNSYLHYDPSTKRWTVAAWDHNLALGVRPWGPGGPFGQGGQGGPGGPGGQGGRFGGPGGIGPGEVDPADADDDENERGGLPGFLFKDNALVDKFHQVASFEAKYEQAKTELTTKLFTGGTAQRHLDRRSATLAQHANDLVTADVLTDEASRVSDAFPKDPKN